MCAKCACVNTKYRFREFDEFDDSCFRLLIELERTWISAFSAPQQDECSKDAKVDACLGLIISRTALTATRHVARCTSRVSHYKVRHARLHHRRCATHRHRRTSVLVICQVCRASQESCDDALRQAMITGAINLPAQTFYPLLPTLTSILGKFPVVIFHCSSSLGRATRCAGWLQDSLPLDSECKVFILEGGMKGWRARFGEDTQTIIEIPAEEGEGTGTRE